MYYSFIPEQGCHGEGQLFLQFKVKIFLRERNVNYLNHFKNYLKAMGFCIDNCL